MKLNFLILIFVSSLGCSQQKTDEEKIENTRSIYPGQFVNYPLTKFEVTKFVTNKNITNPLFKNGENDLDTVTQGLLYVFFDVPVTSDSTFIGGMKYVHSHDIREDTLYLEYAMKKSDKYSSFYKGVKEVRLVYYITDEDSYKYAVMVPRKIKCCK